MRFPCSACSRRQFGLFRCFLVIPTPRNATSDGNPFFNTVCACGITPHPPARISHPWSGARHAFATASVSLRVGHAVTRVPRGSQVQMLWMSRFGILSQFSTPHSSLIIQFLPSHARSKPKTFPHLIQPPQDRNRQHRGVECRQQIGP